jgi:hypothetical protein
MFIAVTISCCFCGYVQGEDYLEVNVDVHTFNYIARKGFNSFKLKSGLIKADVGFVVQGNGDDEMPEQMLCGVHIANGDFNDVPSYP